MTIFRAEENGLHCAVQGIFFRTAFPGRPFRAVFRAAPALKTLRFPLFSSGWSRLASGAGRAGRQPFPVFVLRLRLVVPQGGGAAPTKSRPWPDFAVFLLRPYAARPAPGAPPAERPVNKRFSRRRMWHSVILSNPFGCRPEPGDAEEGRRIRTGLLLFLTDSVSFLAEYLLSLR